jgi:hypothetical protein
MKFLLFLSFSVLTPPTKERKKKAKNPNWQSFEEHETFISILHFNFKSLISAEE